MLVLPLYYCILSKKSPKESHTSKKLGRGRRNTDAIVGQDSSEKKGEHHQEKFSSMDSAFLLFFHSPGSEIIAVAI